MTCTTTQPGSDTYAGLLPRMSDLRVQGQLDGVRSEIARLRASTDWTKTKRSALIRKQAEKEAVILAEVARRAVAAAV